MNTARLLPFLWRALPGKLHRPLRVGDDLFWLGQFAISCLLSYFASFFRCTVERPG